MLVLLFLSFFSVVECNNQMWWLNQKDPFGLSASLTKTTRSTHSTQSVTKPFSWTQRPPSTTSWMWLSPPTRPPCSCVREDICLEPMYNIQLKISAPFGKSDCPSNEVCCKKTKPLQQYIGDSGNGVEDGEFPEDVDVGGPSPVSPPRREPLLGSTEGTLVFNPSDWDQSSEGVQEEVSHNTCGVSDPTFLIDEKMGHGKEDTYANFGEFPWTLLLLEDGDVLCGAVLIERTFALTAAHCVVGKQPDSITVRAGEFDTKDTDEKLEHVQTTVAEYKVHPRFSRSNLINDIAILLLDQPIALSYHIRKICLPEREESFKAPCYATGWGMRGDKVLPDEQSKMKKVAVRPISSQKCSEELRRTDLGPKFRLDKSAMCAVNSSSVDTRFNDGGGPMVCKSSHKTDHFTLVGITSWGKFKYANAPGVYVNVGKFTAWIDDMKKALLGL